MYARLYTVRILLYCSLYLIVEHKLIDLLAVDYASTYEWTCEYYIQLDIGDVIVF